MAENDLRVQLQRAMEMKEKIQDFTKELDRQMYGLDEKLTEYVKQGFPVDLASMYRSKYYTPDKERIDSLCSMMNKAHVEYWDDIIAGLRKAMGE
jgi:hypothetical protein